MLPLVPRPPPRLFPSVVLLLVLGVAGSAVSAPGGGPEADDDLFESPSAETFSFHSTLGKSCIIVDDKRVNSEIRGFQLQGSDKMFNTKCNIRAHRIPEVSSPVVKPGLYFRSGPSGIADTRVFNSPATDLSILDLYSDLLSRFEEYKAPTRHNILNLMAELEGVAHCEEQVRRIISVSDRNSEENEDIDPSGVYPKVKLS